MSGSNPNRLRRLARARVLAAGMVFCFALGLASDSVAAADEGVWLVTAKEAALPESPLRGPRSPLSQGPEIRVGSPTHNGVYASAFPVDIVFVEGPNGVPVNMGSLRVTYRRAWGINITERFQAFAEGQRIQFPDARLPAGQHRLEIYIEDVEENPSSKVLTLEIKAQAEEARP